MKCCQCEKPAFYQLEGGAFLCIDCNLKGQRVVDMEYARNISELNYLADQMEMMKGVSGVVPRYEIPQPTIHMGHTVHNIKIDNSVVGAINTGQIQNMNVVLDNIQSGGSPDLATALQNLTEAILASSELSAEKKQTAVEHLSHIANQAALPKEKRQAAIGKSVIEGFERIIRISGSARWGQQLS